MARIKKVIDRSKKPRAPGRTIEARENKLIALAVDLAERQLSEGTASAQVITHYLKLGSTVERLEREKLKNETQLLAAKTESLKSAKRMEDLYANALAAMKNYSGNKEDQDVEED